MDPMTPAEMKVVREYLGLTTQWLASHLAVAERTVHRWESGTSVIPDGVRESIEQLEAVAANHVDRAVGEYERTPDPTDAPLLTYRTDDDYHAHHREVDYPASWHRAVCARIAQEVPGLTIVYWTR